MIGQESHRFGPEVDHAPQHRARYTPLSTAVPRIHPDGAPLAAVNAVRLCFTALRIHSLNTDNRIEKACARRLRGAIVKKGRHRRYEEARALKRGSDLDIEGILSDLSGESGLDSHDSDDTVDDDDYDDDGYEPED